MEEFKNQNTNWKSVVILLLVVLAVVAGIYYFIGSKDVSIPENSFKDQVQNLVDKVNNDKTTELKEDEEIDPEVIVEEADKLDQEEEEIDKMIDDLGELNI